MQVRWGLAAVVGLLGLGCGAAWAGNLAYTPINPAFGGNPNNSSHLMSAAGAQKSATAWDAPAPVSGMYGNGGISQQQSNANLFISQLEGQLFSALANQVTQSIFGANPQDHGVITFGDTTVVFDRTTSAIILTITGDDGTITRISVPQLVTGH